MKISRGSGAERDTSGFKASMPGEVYHLLHLPLGRRRAAASIDILSEHWKEKIFSGPIGAVAEFLTKRLYLAITRVRRHAAEDEPSPAASLRSFQDVATQH